MEGGGEKGWRGGEKGGVNGGREGGEGREGREEGREGGETLSRANPWTDSKVQARLQEGAVVGRQSFCR
jgi:hypothetical protein